MTLQTVKKRLGVMLKHWRTGWQDAQTSAGAHCAASLPQLHQNKQIQEIESVGLLLNDQLQINTTINTFSARLLHAYIICGHWCRPLPVHSTQNDSSVATNNGTDGINKQKTIGLAHLRSLFLWRYLSFHASIALIVIVSPQFFAKSSSWWSGDLGSHARGKSGTE